MATLNELIKRAVQKPIRRAYIKRRYVDGSHETDWNRIDFLDGEDRVVSWGTISEEIDFQPGQIGSFELSSAELTMDNKDGKFNTEYDPNSIFYPETVYIGRKFSKLRIDAGYIDEDGNEVGVDTIFEGVIDTILVSEDQQAVITALPYASILNSYLVADLSLTGYGTVSGIVSAIMSQSKITQYITSINISNSIDPTINDLSVLEGSYWDVIKELANDAGAVPFFKNSAFYFKNRAAGNKTWDFSGAGTSFPDIFTIDSFDDEGADRIRLYWQAEGTNITVTSSNDLLKTKYLNQPQIVNLDKYDTTNKILILTSLLAQWENPKATISFSTNFMVNQVNVFDKITIKVIGPITPSNYGVWGSGNWGDGSVWGKANRSINISSNAEWLVTRIEKDMDTWVFNIIAERI